MADVAFLCYLNRSSPSDYSPEVGDVGRLVWRGEIPGLYLCRGEVLKDPKDVIALAFQLERPRRGEIDIALSFQHTGELPNTAYDSLRASLFALMSMVNLCLHDHLTPVAPFQIAALEGHQLQVENTALVRIQARHSLSRDSFNVLIDDYGALTAGSDSEKILTALELYGSHFFESSGKTRFLLLVMTLEALATETKKHEVAIAMLQKWKSELDAVLEASEPDSAEHDALEALRRELDFRTTDSILNQIRKLVRRTVPDSSQNTMVKKAAAVYSKRSRLVHRGFLSGDELEEGERDAKEIVELVLNGLIQRRRENVSAQGTDV